VAISRVPSVTGNHPVPMENLDNFGPNADLYKFLDQCERNAVVMVVNLDMIVRCYSSFLVFKDFKTLEREWARVA